MDKKNITQLPTKEFMQLIYELLQEKYKLTQLPILKFLYTIVGRSNRQEDFA